MMLFFDNTYLLVILAMAIVGYAQYRVQSAFSKYSQLESQRRITGKEAAMQILQATGISNVKLEKVAGNLTDHYDPRSKTLRLSDATYNETSVAAVAVAAHEVGHAIQDDKGYTFLKVRSAIAPIVQIGSQIAVPLIFIGLLLSIGGLINLGIIAFSLVLVFQLVTLPVEFDASKRALAVLESSGIIMEDELPAARKVLNAAAFTYIAASISTALQLLRFVLLSNRRRN